MKKSIQRIGIILCTILLLFSITLFAACNKANQNNSSNNNIPTQPTPVEPNKPKEPYSYQPHLSATLPTIHINTTDGSNDFATEYREFFKQNADGSYSGFQKQEFAYQDAKISIDNCENVEKKSNVAAQVKVRGNITSVYNKKPFRIKFAEKQTMLGLNDNYASKDWVLLADWKDASMLRNNIGLYLGQYLYEEAGVFASDFRNVELYLNGEYWGVYLLCEQNEVAKGRININKVEAGYEGTDIGYLVELDDYAEFEKPLNRMQLHYNGHAELAPYDEPDKNIMPFVGFCQYSIKSKIYSNTQRTFIEDYLNNVYTICYKAILEKQYYQFTADKKTIEKADNITDAYTAISNVIDIKSAVAAILLHEIVMDRDINTSSFYMSVDFSATGDGKVYFQAPWDFDTALGWYVGYEVQATDKLYAANSHNPWMVLLYKAEFIQSQIKDTWQTLKKYTVPTKLLQYIDDFTKLYKDAYAKNFAKWENIGDKLKANLEKIPPKDQDNPNLTASFDIIYEVVPEALTKCKTQADAAAYLKNWLQNRFAVLDKIWSK